MNFLLEILWYFLEQLFREHRWKALSEHYVKAFCKLIKRDNSKFDSRSSGVS